ncbi:NHL repeat protein [Rickettsiales bacterium Ac37b]|nr:NHL repeat protein [Rickettsiales bacterium Ac37b]
MIAVMTYLKWLFYPILALFITQPTFAAPIWTTSFGSQGTGDGQFDNPTGITTLPTGEIYVVDGNRNDVQIFNPDTTFSSKFGSPGNGNGEFNLPISIFRSPSTGLLYISDNFNHRVQIFNPDGTYSAQFGSFGDGDGQFMDHYGITMDTVNNKFFVSDVGNNNNPRVQIFNDDGTYFSQFGGFGTANGEFYSPMSLTFGNSQLYVADYFLNNIQTFDENANFLNKFDVSSIPSVYLSRPRDLAVDNAHDMY